MEKETRNILAASMRAVDPESRKVEGYALLFGVYSDGLPWRERIEPGALDGVLDTCDVIACINHDQSRGILARCNTETGCVSLRLSVDDKGLKYEFDAPKTQLGEELLENLRRGEITSSSFCFDMRDGVEEWKKLGEEDEERIIKRFGHIWDVSPVYSAAYSKTSVNLRARESALQKANEEREAARAAEEARKKAEEEARKAEEEKKRAELKAYYEELNAKIPNYE